MLKIARQVSRVFNCESFIRPYQVSAKLNRKQKFRSSNDVFEYTNLSETERLPPVDLSDINQLINLTENELDINQIKCAKFITRLAKQANIAVSKTLTPVTFDATILPEKPNSKLARIFNEESFETKGRFRSFNKKELLEKEMEDIRFLVQNALDQESVGKMHFPIKEGYKELCERMYKAKKKIEDKFGMSYLHYVMKISARKDGDKRKLIENRNSFPEVKKPKLQLDPVEHEKNGFPQTTAVRRINKQYMNKVYNYRLTRTEFSQPLIFDMRFNTTVNTKISHLLKQMVLCYSHNREQNDPMNMVLCNCYEDSAFLKEMEAIENLDIKNVTITEKSYLDLDDQFPREKLVYLSPDSNQTMTEFSPQKIYIIGGVVDTLLRKNLTKSIAITEGIVTERLPLNKYLIWQGRQGLSLDVMLKILLKLRSTDGDWIEAFKAIPTRFHRGLTESAMEMINYDEKTLSHYAVGHIRQELQRRRENVRPHININKALSSYLRHPEYKTERSLEFPFPPRQRKSHNRPNEDKSLDDFFGQ